MNSDEKDFSSSLRKLSDLCMFSQRRFSFFSDGFKCVKRVMVIRFHLFVCMFESVEAKFVSMLDEEKLRNPQMHNRFKEFFEKIFTTLAKLFEFLAMERSKDPECLEQSPVAICTAVQALFSSASKFPLLGLHGIANSKAFRADAKLFLAGRKRNEFSKALSLNHAKRPFAESTTTPNASCFAIF